MQQQSFLSPAFLLLCLFLDHDMVQAVNTGGLRGLQHADTARGDQKRALMSAWTKTQLLDQPQPDLGSVSALMLR